MEQTNKNQVEEITDFPQQSTFNYDNMILKETEADDYCICYADKQAGSRE